MKLPELIIITAGLCTMSASEVTDSFEARRKMFNNPVENQAEKRPAPKTGGVRKWAEVKTKTLEELEKEKMDQKAREDQEAAGPGEDGEKSGIDTKKPAGVKGLQNLIGDKIGNSLGGFGRPRMPLPGLGSKPVLKPVKSTSDPVEPSPKPAVPTTPVTRPRGPAGRKPPIKSVAQPAVDNDIKTGDVNIEQSSVAVAANNSIPTKADEPTLNTAASNTGASEKASMAQPAAKSEGKTEDAKTEQPPTSIVSEKPAVSAPAKIEEPKVISAAPKTETSAAAVDTKNTTIAKPAVNEDLRKEPTVAAVVTRKPAIPTPAKTTNGKTSAKPDVVTSVIERPVVPAAATTTEKTLTKPEDLKKAPAIAAVVSEKPTAPMPAKSTAQNSAGTEGHPKPSETKAPLKTEESKVNTAAPKIEASAATVEPRKNSVGQPVASNVKKEQASATVTEKPSNPTNAKTSGKTDDQPKPSATKVPTTIEEPKEKRAEAKSKPSSPPNTTPVQPVVLGESKHQDVKKEQPTASVAEKKNGPKPAKTEDHPKPSDEKSSMKTEQPKEEKSETSNVTAKVPTGQEEFEKLAQEFCRGHRSAEIAAVDGMDFVLIGSTGNNEAKPAEEAKGKLPDSRTAPEQPADNGTGTIPETGLPRDAPSSYQSKSNQVNPALFTSEELETLGSFNKMNRVKEECRTDGNGGGGAGVAGNDNKKVEEKKSEAAHQNVGAESTRVKCEESSISVKDAEKDEHVDDEVQPEPENVPETDTEGQDVQTGSDNNQEAPKKESEQCDSDSNSDGEDRVFSKIQNGEQTATTITTIDEADAESDKDTSEEARIESAEETNDQPENALPESGLAIVSSNEQQASLKRNSEESQSVAPNETITSGPGDVTNEPVNDQEPAQSLQELVEQLANQPSIQSEEQPEKPKVPRTTRRRGVTVSQPRKVPDNLAPAYPHRPAESESDNASLADASSQVSDEPDVPAPEETTDHLNEDEDFQPQIDDSDQEGLEVPSPTVPSTSESAPPQEHVAAIITTSTPAVANAVFKPIKIVIPEQRSYLLWIIIGALLFIAVISPLAYYFFIFRPRLIASSILPDFPVKP